jgi:uncharacterized protein involved in exopolysaccharide biosynthesis
MNNQNTTVNFNQMDHQEYSNKKELFNFYQLLIKILKLKWSIFLIFFLCIILACLYNSIAENEYSVSASFIVSPSVEKSNIMPSSFLKSNNAVISDYLFGLVESDAIKIQTAKKMQDDFKESSISDIIEKKLILEKRLKLKKNQYNIYTISFIFTDQLIAKRVIKSYLKVLTDFNEKLEINEYRRVFILIDPPELSEKPVRPRKIFNLALSILVATMLSLFYAVTSVALIPFIKDFIDFKNENS